MVGMSDAVDRARIAKIQGWSDSVRTSLMGSRVSEWKFDEAAGTLALDTVGANTGILLPASTGPAWTTSSCVSGACLSFDGVDDYVNVLPSSSFYYDSGYSFGIWFKADRVDVDQGLISQKGGQQFLNLVLDSNQLQWETNQFQSFLTNAFIETGKWYYAVGTYNFSNNSSKIYLNGSLDKQATKTSTKDFTAMPVIIGSYGIGSLLFNGLIDEVRIYNAALPASAIRDNYLAGLDRLLAANQITEQEYRQRLADLDSTYAARE